MLPSFSSDPFPHALDASGDPISAPEPPGAPPRAHAGRDRSPPDLPTLAMPGPFLICGPIPDNSPLVPLMLQRDVRQIVELREMPGGAADRRTLHARSEAMALRLGSRQLLMVEAMLSDPEVAEMPVRRLIVEERGRSGAPIGARHLCEARCVTLPLSPGRYPNAHQLLHAARIVVEARQSWPDSKTLVVGLEGPGRPALVAAAIDLVALADGQSPPLSQEDFEVAVYQQLAALQQHLPGNARLPPGMSRVLQRMWPLMQPAEDPKTAGAARTHDSPGLAAGTPAT